MTQPDGSGSCCTPPNLPPVDAPQEEVTIFLTRASASFRRFTRTPPTKLFPSVNSQNSELSANSHSCSRSLPASACSPIPLVQLQIFRDLVASPSDGGVRLGFGRLQGLGHAAHDASDATPTLRRTRADSAGVVGGMVIWFAHQGMRGASVHLHSNNSSITASSNRRNPFVSFAIPL